MKTYRVVLADDHVLMRDGIRQLLSEIPWIEVVGEVGDGIALVQLLKKIQPDMVILDIAMPGMRGIEAAGEIRSLYPDIDILFLSMHKNREFLAQALATEARGYLLKEDSGKELVTAIEAIRDGRLYLSAKLVQEFPTEILSICRTDRKELPHNLTRRERQVLTLIAEGKTDRQIGRLLFISLKTAQRHRYNIRHKLNLKSTAELVKYAIDNGYLIPGGP